MAAEVRSNMRARSEVATFKPVSWLTNGVRFAIALSWKTSPPVEKLSLWFDSSAKMQHFFTLMLIKKEKKRKSHSKNDRLYWFWSQLTANLCSPANRV